jgi:hypothetical protein
MEVHVANRMKMKMEIGLEPYRPSGAAGAVPGSYIRKVETWRDERIECGNAACTRGWLRLLKDWRRPMFEGRWGCSAGCMEAIVEAAVRRELGEGRATEEDRTHRHRVPLGLVLLAQGLITQPQLQQALDAQRLAGHGRIGSWLVSECGLKEERVTRALGLQWNCPVLPMEGFDPGAMALLAPKLLVEKLEMVPLRIAGGRILYLAFEDRLDASAAFAMERMSGLKVQSGLVDGVQLKAARQRLCECDFVDAAFEQVPDIESVSGQITLALGRHQPRASRLARVHQFYWLRMWLEKGAMSTRDGGVPTTKEDVVDRIYTVGYEQ